MLLIYGYPFRPPPLTHRGFPILQGLKPPRFQQHLHPHRLGHQAGQQGPMVILGWGAAKRGQSCHLPCLSLPPFLLILF